MAEVFYHRSISILDGCSMALSDLQWGMGEKSAKGRHGVHHPREGRSLSFEYYIHIYSNNSQYTIINEVGSTLKSSLTELLSKSFTC